MEGTEFREHVIKRIRQDLYTSIEMWLPTVERAGADRLKACNPLRGDKNPDSMTIYPDGTAFDFAADQKLDCIDLWAAVRGMSNTDALKYHADRLGLNLTPLPRSGATHFDHPIRVAEPAVIAEPNVAPEAYPIRAFTHFKHGHPSAVYTYKTRKGQLIGYTCRFDLGEGRKEVLPFTWSDLNGKVHTGTPGWHWNAHGWNGVWPLYGAEKLTRELEALVVIVEGEKTADAAQELFPEYVVVSWAGGCSKASKVDWTALAGRTIAIWPDADQKYDKATGYLLQPAHQPGMKASLAIARALKDCAHKVTIVIPPADVKDGWDLADAVTEGWNSNRATGYLWSSCRTLEELEVEFAPTKPRLSVVKDSPGTLTDSETTQKQTAASTIRQVSETPVEIAHKVLGFLRKEIEAPDLDPFRATLEENSFNADVLAAALRTINKYQYTKESVLRDALVHLENSLGTLTDSETTRKQTAASTIRQVSETPVEIAHKALGFLRKEIEAPDLEPFRATLEENSFNADVLAAALRTINKYQYTKESVLRDALLHLGVAPSQAKGTSSGNSRMKPLSSSDILAIVTNTFGYNLRFNEVLEKVEIDGQPRDDRKANEILDRCYCEAPKLGPELARENLVRRAMDAAPGYNPFKEYLQGSEARYLEWQQANPGKSPVDEVLSHMTFPDDEEKEWFSYALGKWCQGHAARIFSGWQNRVLILQGAQGIGKSTIARSLAKNLGRRYFTDETINPSNKDCIINMAETFVWEVGEIGGSTSNTDPNMLKAFLTKEVINVRKPYARDVSTLTPYASFIGTSNDETFLHDMTGSRRFVCVKVDAIERKWFRDNFDPDILWGWALAEARMCDFQPDFSEEMKSKSETRNEDFRVENPIESTIEDLVEVDSTGFLGYEELKHRLQARGVNDINTSCKRWKFVVSVVTGLGGKRTKARTLQGVRAGFWGVRLRTIV